MPLSSTIRSALVTGAGSGLGAAFADMLVREGVRVWGTSRQPDRLVGRSGISAVALDLAEPSTIDIAWDRVQRESGGIDLLVNNAGAATFGAWRDDADATWARDWQVLFHGPVALARLACRAMRKRGGIIVNVTSLAVEFPLPYMASYNAAKTALASVTAALAREAAEDGVIVIDFRPGDHATPFNDALRAQFELDQLSPAEQRVWRRQEMLQRSAPPAARAARDLRQALARRRAGIVRTGGFFQVRLARWGNRLLPARLMRLFADLYFQLK